jgi:D-3-phosphoglycerate dehydrogenase
LGIGYDRVDIAAATAAGVAVCNTPDGPTLSTAEFAITLMMAVARNLKQIAYNGAKPRPQTSYQAIELYGKQLGLVGLGRIGTHVARIAKAMGMPVVAYDPYITPEKAAETGVELADSLEMLLGASDIVSLHLPLTDENRKLMNAERFAQMKRGAIFINTARGGHVDEAALLAALDSGHLFGAGLDVTDPEPPESTNPLLFRENVIITPHIASGTFEGRDRMFEMAFDQILQVFRGEHPPYLINPEVWPRVLEKLSRA